MKKIAATVLAAVLLTGLTACDGRQAAEGQPESSVSESSSTESESSLITEPENPSSENSDNSSVASESYQNSESSSEISAPESEEYQEITLSDGTEAKLYGTPKSAENFIDLKDFADRKGEGYEDWYKDIKSYLTDEEYEENQRFKDKNIKALNDILASIGDEAAEKYIKAYMLLLIFPNDTHGIARGLEGVHIEIPYAFDEERDYEIRSWYNETGISYDSFRREFCEVFSERIFDKCMVGYHFCTYNGEVWLRAGGVGSNLSRIYTDYELVKNTDTEIVFNSVYYCRYQTTEKYDESQKDQYKVERRANRFIKTENGWRVAEISVTGGDHMSLSEDYAPGAANYRDD